MATTISIMEEDGKSVRIGTTGTIGSLMTRELESIHSMSRISLSRNKASMVSASFPSSASASKRLQPRTSSDGASSSKSVVDQRSPETGRRTKTYTRKSHHRVPMLGADNVALDGTPTRVKSEKKGSVEIVDIKCGHTERTWSSPIANRLKKLGFSKLSQSMI